MSGPVLCTPLRVEQAMLYGARRSMRLVRTGMGPRRAAATAATLGPGPVLVAGVGGGLVPQVRPGDVVVASEVRTAVSSSALSPPNSTAGLFRRRRTALLLSSGSEGVDPNPAAGSVAVPSAPLLAGALRRLGLSVHLGPISSVSRIAWSPATNSSLAVDMESAKLATAEVPFAVVRAIVDTTDHPLWHVGTLRRGVTALRTLRACQPALEWWAAATGPREVLLAAPRTDGVCSAATDRERVVRAIAREVDLVLVVGSGDSASSLCLAEVAQREGAPAYLVGDVSEIDLRWLAGVTRLGVTAGADAAPHLVDQIVHCLGGLGPVRVHATVALPHEVS